MARAAPSRDHTEIDLSRSESAAPIAARRSGRRSRLQDTRGTPHGGAGRHGCAELAGATRVLGFDAAAPPVLRCRPGIPVGLQDAKPRQLEPISRDNVQLPSAAAERAGQLPGWDGPDLSL